MTTHRHDALLDALAALQPFYKPGDDGYPIELALNAVAGVLGDKAEVVVDGKSGLTQVLEALDAPSQLQKDVKKLYLNAKGGEYGAGLSKKQARTVNDLVQSLYDELVEYVSKFRPRARRHLPRKKA
jgi:hypothetical protein